MKSVISFLILTIVVVNTEILAGEGQSGVPSLMLDSYGARGMAMGDAFTGIADDVDTILVNPAGLNNLNSVEASVSYLQYPLDMDFAHVSLAVPLPGGKKTGSVGAAITLFSMSPFDQLDYTGNKEEGELSARDLVLCIGYAANPLLLLGMKNVLNIGIGFKYVNSRLVEDSRSTFCLDAGVIYKTGFLRFGNKAPKRNLGVGASIQNLGGSIKYGSEKTLLPINMRMGVGYRPYKGEIHGMNWGFEVNLPNDSMMIISCGLEYSFLDIVFIRGGYKISGREVDSFSCGGGIKYSLFGIDYAFVPLTDLGAMHSFSLVFKYKPSREFKRPTRFSL